VAPALPGLSYEMEAKLVARRQVLFTERLPASYGLAASFVFAGLQHTANVTAGEKRILSRLPTGASLNLDAGSRESLVLPW
jgi:hypothetical protein